MAKSDEGDLGELLEETRILLPGSEVLVAFLIAVPFNDRFVSLSWPQKLVYLVTFLSALGAFVCFVMPAAYHRLARPIMHRERFKIFANRFLIAGVVPMSLSLVSATYLVTSLAFSRTVAIAVASAAAALIGVLWWVIPLARLHGTCPTERERNSSDSPSADCDPHSTPATGVTR